MSDESLAAHVEELAQELGIVVIPSWVGSLVDDCTDLPCGAAGRMELEDGDESFPVIWVSDDPVTAKPYLVALHELGHHATAHLATEQDELTREHLAWQWAEARSLIPITPRLGAFIARRLNSYRD